MRKTGLLLGFALLLAVGLLPQDLPAQTDFPDLRSGERALHDLLGTGDLGPLRKRAAEIGSREVALQRSRMLSRKTAGALGALASPVWTSIGPTYRSIARGTASNAGNVSGLAAGIALHPTDPKTIWLATSGGGIWKTSDGGATWRPTTDDLGPLPTGAVAVSRSNPSRVYAGTGCGDSSSSYQSAPGFGVLISNDGGETWRISAAGATPGNNFFELSIDPANPDMVLAATDKGIQRSTDGGDSWRQVVPIPAYSLSRSSASPAVVFGGTWKSGGAAGSVWKSTDGGSTFTEKAAGLPGSPATRARPEVAVAPSDPSRVYALFSDTANAQVDMVISTDGGDSWNPLGLAAKHVDILGSQGNYFSDVAVDPSNPDTVYAGGLDRWKSTDAGTTWAKISDWRGIGFVLPYVHADQHDTAFGTDGSIYFTTDGGIFKTTDGGLSFTSLNRGLVTIQFYKICQTPASPDLVMGGAQDNGTSLRVQGTEYREVVGGDGFSCLAHPTDPLILHGTAYLEYIERSTDGGVTWRDASNGITDAGDDTNGWFPTILQRHPVFPDWIYTSSLKKLWASKNAGTSWASPSGDISASVSGLTAIRDFSLLPTDGSRIAIAANAGKVLESQDGGVTFRLLGTLPVNTLSAVRYDRTDLKTVYVSSTLVTPGVERVWVTHDSGATWQPLSRTGQPGGLPDLPVMTLEQDPFDANVLWAGSYVGVYRSGDGGQSWARFGEGLPNVMAMSIGISPTTGLLRLGTFGRGIWEIATGAVPANRPPTVQIVFPPSGPTFEAGVQVSFQAAGSDPDPGDAVAFSWDFGDGSGRATGASATHAFALPGRYTVTLTGTDLHGASATSTRAVTISSPTLTGASLLLPVVLETPGAGGSYYTSEVTIGSRRSTPVDVLLTYTASAGGGSGFARLSLAPSEQKILPGILGWLRGRGLPIPEGTGARVGTLLATFSGTSSADALFLGARTFTADPAGAAGTFGLFYLSTSTPFTGGPLTVCGLQQNASQRSNLGLVNAGPDPITLRTRLVGPKGQDLGTVDTSLGAYGWAQLNAPLASTGFASGVAVVSAVSGSPAPAPPPFFAYGVLNDAVTSDGSFIPSLPPGDLQTAESFVPVVLRAAGYATELTLTNLTGESVPLMAAFVASPQLGSGAGTGWGVLTLEPHEQRIEPDAMAFLARLGVPVPASGDVAGSLHFTDVSAKPAASSFAAGARTFIPAPSGGTFGLFYTGLTFAKSAAAAAYVQGLQQNAAQRSNLAVVNRGDAGDPITLRVTYYGPDGSQVGSADTKTLVPGEWAQFNRPLESRGVTAGSAKIEKLSGASRFVAYGVLNDQTNSDGSYIPMTR